MIGTLEQHLDFGFRFLVTENRDLRFYQRYPAIFGYYVIFEKMTFGDLWMLRYFQKLSSGLDFHKLLNGLPLPVRKFGNFRSINSIILKTILRRCPHVTDKIVIAVVKYIEHPIAF